MEIDFLSPYSHNHPLFICKINALKNIVSLLLLSFSFMHLSLGAYSQTKQSRQTNNSGPQSFRRCGTTEMIDNLMRTSPAFRLEVEARKKQLQLSKTSQFGTARVSQLTGPVTIPVVVHIVLPNPHIVTDADIQYFLDRLNRDFSGFNADSTNGSAFYNVRGHSLLRFKKHCRLCCLH